MLVVGDEDDIDSVWTPRIVAAGGDESHVFGLKYSSGVPIDLVRDIALLEKFVREHEIQVIYFDQILDHLGADLNAQNQKDVRIGLAPVRSLARRLDIAVVYTAHPNKMSGARSLRERAGGSGQFTDLPRSGLLVGYHPELTHVRVVARGKGNVGAVPRAIAF